jgi:hypothetical protein
MSVRLPGTLKLLFPTARRATLLAAMLGASSVFAAPKASGPPRCERCSDLPMLEGQFFQQEFLRKAFEEYVNWKLPSVPSGYEGTAKDFMVETITAAFSQYLNSPAGGGGGTAAAELGTDFDTCTLVFYVKDAQGRNVIDPKTKKPKSIPFDENAYRAKNCKAIADYLLAHENQHVADCKSQKRDLSSWLVYATYDARAYAAGMRNLRKSIAQLATRCGWEGSTHSTKKDAEGSDAPVIPTPEEVKTLAHALKTGGHK